MGATNRLWVAIALALAALLAVPGVAVASEHGASAPGESNLGFLLVALLIAWAGFFAYTFYLSRKTREMRREIDELREQLSEKADRGK